MSTSIPHHSKFRRRAGCTRIRRSSFKEKNKMGAAFLAAAALLLTLVGPGVLQDLKDPAETPCTTADGKAGLCVPPFQCDTYTNTIDKDAFIDLRIGGCPTFLQICCMKQEKEQLPSCGWGNPGASSVRDGESELVTTADYGEFPWMVAILRNTAPEEEWSQEHFLGGGSIIHPSVVITAAHKVDGLFENEIKCRAGEWDTKDESELYPTQERNVKLIITHDDFFRVQVYYNVALLFLEKPFTFRGAPHIGVGCLGRQLPEPDTECFTMGWGKDFKGAYAATLKKIKVPLVDFEVCQRKLRNTRLGSRFKLHPTLMCAGGQPGVDSCKGDGGSSLVCPIMDPKKGIRYAIFGIVSSGVSCGKKNVPGVYVNIPSIYDWVVDKMNEQKFQKSAFTY